MKNNYIDRELWRFIFKWLLIAAASVLCVEYFLMSYVGGDIATYGYWWMQLIRKHLSVEFSLPYFTPARCGGFLLLGDAQVYAFSLYTLVSFFIPNIEWTVKIVNFCMTLILGTGVYFWLKYFGIKDKLARLFSAILISLSGYWVFKVTNDGGFLQTGCVVYIPWVMILVEVLLERRIDWESSYLKVCLFLIAFFFLMMNSGYFWLQTFIYIFAARLLVELLYPQVNRLESLKRTGIIFLACGLGIVLSWPRLGAIYEFQLTKFARFGSEINHMGVIGSTGALLKIYIKSFFDGQYLREGVGERNIGGFWEVSNFIGLAAIVPLIIGLTKWSVLRKSKIFLALVLTCIFQFGLTRSTHVSDVMRALLPVLKQITHNFRGSFTVLLLLIVFIAAGYERCLNFRKNIVFFLFAGLMFLNLWEIQYTYFPRLDFSIGSPAKAMFVDTNPPPEVVTSQYATCELCHLFGYGVWGQIPQQLSFNPKLSVYDSPELGFYNLHDVRVLSSSAANGSFYMKNKWPLWPKADAEEFTKFINYQQVTAIPLRLKVLNWISLVTWFLFIIAVGFVVYKELQFKRLAK